MHLAKSYVTVNERKEEKKNNRHFKRDIDFKGGMEASFVIIIIAITASYLGKLIPSHLKQSQPLDKSTKPTNQSCLNIC